MSDVSRIGPALLRIERTATPGPAVPDLPVGTPLAARVEASSGGGRWIVEVAGRQLVAETTLALVAGDRLSVIAHRSDAGFELRVVRQAIRFNEAQYAAATLAQAGARPPGLLPSSALAALSRGLHETSAQAPAAAPHIARLVEALAELSTPLHAGRSVAALADAVRRIVEDTGLLFESRVRVALSGRDAAGSSESALPASVQRDARVLLGGLARALNALPSPGGEPAASGAMSAPANSPSLVPASRDIVETILARQIDLAAQWLHSGRLTLGVPLMLGDREVVAELRLDADDAGTSAPAGRRAFAFDVRVELPDLGHLEATVRWAGGEIATRVCVDRPALEPVARQELARLADGLRGAGFQRVSADVVVDPVRLARVAEAPVEPVQGGAIFDARI